MEACRLPVRSDLPHVKTEEIHPSTVYQMPQHRLQGFVEARPGAFKQWLKGLRSPADNLSVIVNETRLNTTNSQTFLCSGYKQNTK
ncbi:MAG: hypothetical protein WKF97_24355 [Chitinophagaceae bacterium]